MFVLFNFKCLCYMSLFVTIYFQKTEADQKGPGVSLCNIVATNCNAVPICPVDFPDGCTSFIFTSLQVDENHTVTFGFPDSNNDYLDILGQSGKSLFANFGRDSYTDWAKILDSDGKSALLEATGINSFKSGHPGITGLILRNLEPTVNETTQFIGFTESVSKYIEIVKQKTGLGIAFSFHSDDFVAYYDDPPMAWMNFTIIDSSVDFYVFALFSFTNKCSGNSGAVLPISGDDQYTLEKLEGAIKKSLIPKHKIYFDLVLAPQSDDDVCHINYQTLCEFPNKAKYWCTDTQETMFKKGQWFRQNGAGFIGGNIDFDDPQNVCKCGKYPSFNAILAGFNGTTSVPVCPLYDRVV